MDVQTHTYMNIHSAPEVGMEKICLVHEESTAAMAEEAATKDAPSAPAATESPDAATGLEPTAPAGAATSTPSKGEPSADATATVAPTPGGQASTAAMAEEAATKDALEAFFECFAYLCIFALQILICNPLDVQSCSDAFWWPHPLLQGGSRAGQKAFLPSEHLGLLLDAPNLERLRRMLIRFQEQVLPTNYILVSVGPVSSINACLQTVKG